jgi:hypothetical protein
MHGGAFLSTIYAGVVDQWGRDSDERCCIAGLAWLIRVLDDARLEQYRFVQSLDT